MLQTNEKRREALRLPFNPLTGEGAPGKRFRLELDDYELPVQYLPEAMKEDAAIQELMQLRNVKAYVVRRGMHLHKFIDRFRRLRFRHDFYYWAHCNVMIKPKGEGSDVPFCPNMPQRRLIETFEAMRREEKPIRVILLKARQWGGSTATQIYMAWLQLIHRRGMNSLIVGHQKDAAAEVCGMFEKLIDAYPDELLYDPGSKPRHKEKKMLANALTRNIRTIPQRGCKIKVGSAKMPDSARGGDATLVHCTEVAFWEKTEGKSPEQIVRSACSGTLPRPMTMIVYESTANGVGNFFQREYEAAKRGTSIFLPVFVAWWQIETYQLDFASDAERSAFAEWLSANRESEQADSAREEPPRYLWHLWEAGATLEAINWYRTQRRAYADHGDMAAEYPSDDVEAFVHSGARVFDYYKVQTLRKTCRPPRLRGEIAAHADEGPDALRDLRFADDSQGALEVWALPEADSDKRRVANRYLAVVDIGGRSAKADWSVVCVFDRLWMTSGGNPSVVAQWYGHTDMDRLAWKAAQIAAFYNNALLVVESNTLETRDRDRIVEGDQAPFILNQIRDAYPNLYARRQSEEEIRQGAPRKYGFHTNIATKPMVISTLVRCVREGLYIERDVRCTDELLTYERRQNGSYGAIAGHHDDLLMTRAIGLHICYHDMPQPQIVGSNRHRQATQLMLGEAFF